MLNLLIYSDLNPNKYLFERITADHSPLLYNSVFWFFQVFSITSTAPLLINSYDQSVQQSFHNFDFAGLHWWFGINYEAFWVRELFLGLSLLNSFGCVVYWLLTYSRKPKVPGSSPATSHVQRWALCSNRLGNGYVLVKLVKVVWRN